jgi:hypothetical protein
VTRRKKPRLRVNPHSSFNTFSIVASRPTLVYTSSKRPVAPSPDTLVCDTNVNTWSIARSSAGFSAKFCST